MSIPAFDPKLPFCREYQEAVYELSVVDSGGKVIAGKCVPWRFNRVLTQSEMEYGSKHGFRKFAVPFFGKDSSVDNP